MKKLDDLTRDELSLLLYFEDCAVNQSGRIDSRRMNVDDRVLASTWNTEEFVRYGRISSEHLSDQGSHWVQLSDEAWSLASEARKARALRLWGKRSWITTEEKRK